MSRTRGSRSQARRQQGRAPAAGSRAAPTSAHPAQPDSRRSTRGGGMKLERLGHGQQGSPCGRPAPASACSPPGGTSGGRAGLTPRTRPGGGGAPPGSPSAHLTHMLLKRNRSSQVKARSVVIPPPPKQNRRDFARPAGSHPVSARPAGSHPANYRPSGRRRTSSGSPVAWQPRSDAAPSSGKLGIASPPL